jgi:glycosyltransferase involved in cell wall biosynthesis
MRLGVPHYESSGWIAGSIYVRNLAAALARLPAAEQPELVFLAGPSRSRALMRGARARGQKLLTYGYLDGCEPWRAGACVLASLGNGGSTLSLTAAARRAGIDVLFPVARPLPDGAGVPWMGWVPDYQHKCLPALWPPGHRYTRDIEALSEISRYLVVSSEDARRHAERFFNRSRNVSALPFSLVATDEWYAADPLKVAARYKLPERFVIFPSQFWKHKDHATLIEAMARLRAHGRRDIKLVLSGWPHDTRDPAHGPAVLSSIRCLGLERQVQVLGLIERADVIALMRRSVGIVQPSRFEGWSALVEEARSLGKPVVLSDIAVHKEQDPPHARFFRTGDVAALADAVAALWDTGTPGPHGEIERDARAHSDARAIAFARRFIKTAEDAIRVFNEDGRSRHGQ